MKSRIHLSLSHMGGHELNYVSKAFEDNWVTTVGPNVTGFEQDLQQFTGAEFAVALSSGTAAIHLGLRSLGVGPGDEVLCSTFTFIATANPIVYLGASPVFIDSDAGSWNMCPNLLRQAIQERMNKGKKPKAIVVVHLYGASARMQEIKEIADRFGIPVLEDAAEALGSSYQKKPLGTIGKAGIFSFNGNKIITTAGGGAFITNTQEMAQQVRFLATQAKDPAPHYQHSQIGYNYAPSNINAGIGRGQMEVLEKRVKQRREIHQFYREAFAKIPGIGFQEEVPESVSNRWLTCILIDKKTGILAGKLREELEKENIESRPLWKPLHLQPVFRQMPAFLNEVSETLFETGLCLPSGSSLAEEDLERVAAVVCREMGKTRRS